MTGTKPTGGERFEGVVLVIILLTVAAFAGAASFTHVHDWTMDNSPDGTGDWFGWANAVVSELVPTAAALVMRRRKRAGLPTGYPTFLLMCAVAVSLAAQLAVAKPSVSGWLLSAVPALAFLGLTKLILSPTKQPDAAPALVPAAVVTSQPEPVAIPSALLPGARIIAESHAETHGVPIPADVLAERMSVDVPTAGRLLQALAAPTGPRQPARLNGVQPQEASAL